MRSVMFLGLLLVLLLSCAHKTQLPVPSHDLHDEAAPEQGPCVPSLQWLNERLLEPRGL